jgi:rabenosyn-5
MKPEDAAGKSFDVRPVVASSSIGTPHSSANPAPSEGRPIIAGPSSGSTTFRRLGPKQPAFPSPLRPRNAAHSQAIFTRPTVLVLDSAAAAASSDSNAREKKAEVPPDSPTESIPRTSTISNNSNIQPTASGSRKFSPANTPRTSTPALPTDIPTSPTSVSPTNPSPHVLSPEHKTLAAASPRVASPAPPSPIPIPPSSASAAFTAQKAPYRQGFQPKGAYRILTEEFLATRNRRTNAQRGEERRIERRLEKVRSIHLISFREMLINFINRQLINLHFPPESSVSEPNARPPSSTRRSSSFFDISEFGGRSPGNLLRSVVEPKPGTPAALRGPSPCLFAPFSSCFLTRVLLRTAAEQIITPWQEDSAATKCPHCQ